MVTIGFAVSVVIAVLASLFMAWALGASSNSPPFAPAVGANAISTMRAALLIGVLATAGAVTQGGSISDTVGNQLVGGVAFTPTAATLGLVTAATYLVLGVYSGYPIPAAFATTGAMVGVGLALGGDPAWGVYQRIGTFWLLVPVVSGGMAFVTATLLRRDDIPETIGVPLLGAFVGGLLPHVRLGVIPAPPGRDQGTLAGVVSRTVGGGLESLVGVDPVAALVTVGFAAVAFWGLRRRTQASVDRGIRTFLLVLGSVVAFSSGGSQVGLATGPLEHLVRVELGLPGIALLGLGGVGILAGAWMGAPRLLWATSREYAQLGVRRSIAALVPGFVIAQVAIALGIPISFNNIIISGVVGSGLAAGATGVSRRKIGLTVVVWLLTLASSIGIGYGLFAGVSTLFGIR